MYSGLNGSRPEIRKPNVSTENRTVYSNLEREKCIIKNSITRIKDRIVGNNTDLDAIELECQLDMLNSYSEQLLRCQSKIEALDKGNPCREELEDLIVETKTEIKTILANTLIAPHNPELPKVNLPKFDGKYAEYKNFMRQFESVVHNDSMKSDITKFNSLVNSLSGEALDMIQSFQRSAENYPKVLAKLKEKYDNKCLNLFDAMSVIYDSLLSQGDEKNITNAIIIHLVMHNVDPATRSKFKEQLDYGKLPAWHDLETVLHKCYQQLSADEPSTLSSRTQASGPISILHKMDQNLR